MTAPPIPTRPCASCGVPTNETASVHGVMHDQCYRAYSPNNVGERIDAALADHMSGKPMEGFEVPKSTHRVKIEICVHTQLPATGDEWYRSIVATACQFTQGAPKLVGAGRLIMGSADDNKTHLMVEFGVPELCTTLDSEPQSALQPHQQRVVAEHAELADRLQKLGKFLYDKPPAFLGLPLEEQDLLQRQLDAMTVYHDILVERIAGFAGA